MNKLLCIKVEELPQALQHSALEGNEYCQEFCKYNCGSEDDENTLADWLVQNTEAEYGQDILIQFPKHFEPLRTMHI